MVAGRLFTFRASIAVLLRIGVTGAAALGVGPAGFAVRLSSSAYSQVEACKPSLWIAASSLRFSRTSLLWSCRGAAGHLLWLAGCGLRQFAHLALAWHSCLKAP